MICAISSKNGCCREQHRRRFDNGKCHSREEVTSRVLIKIKGSLWYPLCNLSKAIVHCDRVLNRHKVALSLCSTILGSKKWTQYWCPVLYKEYIQQPHAAMSHWHFHLNVTYIPYLPPFSFTNLVTLWYRLQNLFITKLKKSCQARAQRTRTNPLFLLRNPSAIYLRQSSRS